MLENDNSRVNSKNKTTELFVSFVVFEKSGCPRNRIIRNKYIIVMFDIFGIRKRREEKRKAKEALRQEQLKEEKRKYQERKKLICDWLAVYNKEQSKKCSAEYAEEKKRVEEKNSKCPKCGSTNVINHIRRTKGEIHGSGHISGSSSHYGGLFSSSSHSSIYGSSKIDGELDTLPVNKCNDCGNEWMIEEVKFPHSHNIFSTYNSVCPMQLYYRAEEYLELTYDPTDIKEEANSLEEKRQKYIERVSNSTWLNFFKDVPRYMVDYAMYKGLTEHNYRAENAHSGFGWNDELDEYSYRIPDELWNVVKKLINWTGKE